MARCMHRQSAAPMHDGPALPTGSPPPRSRAHVGVCGDVRTPLPCELDVTPRRTRHCAPGPLPPPAHHASPLLALSARRRRRSHHPHSPSFLGPRGGGGYSTNPTPTTPTPPHLDAARRCHSRLNTRRETVLSPAPAHHASRLVVRSVRRRRSQYPPPTPPDLPRSPITGRLSPTTPTPPPTSTWRAAAIHD